MTRDSEGLGGLALAALKRALDGIDDSSPDFELEIKDGDTLVLEVELTRGDVCLAVGDFLLLQVVGARVEDGKVTLTVVKEPVR